MATLIIGTNVEDGNTSVDVGGSNVGGQQIVNNLLGFQCDMSNASMHSMLGQENYYLKARLMALNLEPLSMSNVTFDWINFLKFTHVRTKN